MSPTGDALEMLLLGVTSEESKDPAGSRLTAAQEAGEVCRKFWSSCSYFPLLKPASIFILIYKYSAPDARLRNSYCAACQESRRCCQAADGIAGGEGLKPDLPPPSAVKSRHWKC